MVEINSTLLPLPSLITATLNDARPKMGNLQVQQADIQCINSVDSEHIYQNEFLCKPPLSLKVGR